MKIYSGNIKILLVILLVIFLNNACKKEIEYELLSGQLIGYIDLIDENNQKLEDNSGIEIILEGGNKEIKVLTDKNGQFIIDDLKSGIYNLTFNKDGFYQHKIVSYQFIGGNKPAAISKTYLYEISNVQIEILEFREYTLINNIKLIATAKVSNLPQNSNHHCRYYLDNKSDVSYKNYMSTSTFYASNYHEVNSVSFQIDTVKFPIGSELFIIMYPASETMQYYTDINTGNKIYTSVNFNKPSNVTSIIIPEVESPW